jgi:ABC-2 type transport system ATP-binding protein
MFDEPTNGLDPVGIAETRELIKKLNAEGKTIIMASHLLDEVEKVCTHVAVLLKGTLITHGHVDEILVNEDIVELGSNAPEQLLSVLQDFPSTSSVRKNGLYIEATFPSGVAELDSLNQYCFQKGIVLNHLRLRRKSLEAKFFELTKAN